MGFELTRPWALLLLLTLIPVVWLTRAGLGGPGSELGKRRRRQALLLRSLILILLVLALAGLRQTLPSDQLAVIFVVDRSLSTQEHQAFMLDYMRSALPGLGPHDRVGIVTFGDQAALELPASRPTQIHDFTAVVDRQSSDLAGALRFASACFPAGHACRIILLSDGNETRGNAVEEAQLARQLGIEVWTVPLPATRGLEVLVESLQVPGRPTAGAPFEAAITVVASQACKATLSLRRNGQTVADEAVELNQGRNLFLVPQKAGPAGVYNYDAQIVAPGDREAANNRASGVAVVAGPNRILYVCGDQGQGPLPELLRSRGLAVDVVRAAELPVDLGSWQAYQSVVWDDVSALDTNPRQLEWLTAMVRDVGLGFAMLGGPDSYGAGGYYESPLAKALPVSLDVKKRKNAPVVGLMMLIDKSGSMEELDGKVQKLAMAREAAISALGLMSPADLAGVIGFDSAFKWVVNFQPVTNPKAMAGAIATLRAGGGTNLYPGLKAALDTLEKAPSALKHVIILTDGEVEPADYEGLTKRARSLKVTVSTVAVGQDADLPFLSKLAHDGKGMAYVANQASLLPRIFTRDTVLASRMAFVEKPFVPVAAQSHPVLGTLDLTGAAPLLGCNLVTPGPAPAQMLLSSPEGDPVLAVGRYGLGKTMAWTSDNGRRWAKGWALWPDFAALMLQAVRWTLPDSESGSLSLRMEPQGDGKVHLVAESASPVLAPLEAGLVSPEGDSQRLSLVPTGPGRYEGDFQASAPGSWLVHLGDPESQTGLTRVYSVPYSPEFASVGTNRALLEKVAEAGGGQFDAPPVKVFSPPVEPPRLATEVWPRLLLAAMWLLMLDVAIRRVMLPLGWFGRWRARAPVEAPAQAEVTASRLLVRKREVAPAAGGPREAPAAAPTVAKASPAPAPPVVVEEGGSLARLKKAKGRARGDGEGG